MPLILPSSFILVVPLSLFALVFLPSAGLCLPGSASWASGLANHYIGFCQAFTTPIAFSSLNAHDASPYLNRNMHFWA